MNNKQVKLMFKALKNIEHGVIYLTNFDDKKYILGSEDQKKFDASGRVIPTSTFQPTDVTEQLGITNVNKDKNPITEIIKHIFNAFYSFSNILCGFNVFP